MISGKIFNIDLTNFKLNSIANQKILANPYELDEA